MSEPTDVPEHLKGEHVFSGKPYGILTAQNPMYPVSHPGENNALETRLKQEGLSYHPVHGNYGKDEQSYIVHNPKLSQMLSMGKDFGQESVIFGAGGHHGLHYTNGPDVGTYHPTLPERSINYHSEKPEQFYTTLPENKGHFNVNLDWGRKLPLANLGKELAKSIG